MKVNPLLSLGAKLFYLMTILVAATVAGLSWQSSRTMQTFLERTIQDDLVTQSEKTATQVSSLLETWINQIATSMADSAKRTPAELTAQLSAMVAQNRNLLAFHILKAPKDAATAKDLVAIASGVNKDAVASLGAKDITDTILLQKLESLLEPRLGTKSGVPVIIQLTPVTKVPAMAVAMRFDTETPGEFRWGILSVLQARLMALLSAGAEQRTRLVDRDGRLFASKQGDDMKTLRKLDSLPIVKDALSMEGGQGFKREYRDAQGRLWIGAFSKLDKFDGITLLMERDAASAFGDTRKVIVRSALWGLLFIMIAVMCAWLVSSGITRGLREVTDATYRIASGDFSTAIQPRSADEVGFLSFAVNHMAGQILGLMESQVEKARLDKELETAKMVQSTFFPRQDITTSSLRITGFNQPASECGGDLWGWFSVRPGVDFVFVADAMGHGTPAALVTAVAYASYVSVADLIKTQSLVLDSPAQVLRHMNKIILDAVEGKITMTAFAAFIDSNKGEIVYANAGHNHPFLLPFKADDTRLGKKKSKDGAIMPISLQLAGAPLGSEASPNYETKSLPLAAGDRFILFTDGLIECENPAGKQWGRKSLSQAIGRLSAQDPSQYKQKLVNEAFQFFDNVPVKDDVTIVVVDLDAAWKSGAEPSIVPIAVDKHDPEKTLTLAPAAAPAPIEEPATESTKGPFLDIGLDAGTGAQPAPAPLFALELPMGDKPTS